MAPSLSRASGVPLLEYLSLSTERRGADSFIRHVAHERRGIALFIFVPSYKHDTLRRPLKAVTKARPFGVLFSRSPVSGLRSAAEAESAALGRAAELRSALSPGWGPSVRTAQAGDAQKRTGLS